MILAANLCLLWLVINFYIILPKKITKDEMLFLFLTSSITIMLSLLIPAKRFYFGDPGFRYSVGQAIAFFINRNAIFPLLTMSAVNLMQFGAFWQKSVTASSSLIIFLLYTHIEEKYTIVSHISLPLQILFFILYTFLILFLLKGFRVLAKTESSG